jgi:hypothetical protein
MGLEKNAECDNHKAMGSCPCGNFLYMMKNWIGGDKGLGRCRIHKKGEAGRPPPYFCVR